MEQKKPTSYDYERDTRLLDHLSELARRVAPFSAAANVLNDTLKRIEQVSARLEPLDPDASTPPR